MHAYEDYFLRYHGWEWFAVVDADGRYVGLAHRAAMEHAAHEEGGAVAARDVVARGDREAQVRADAPLEALLASEPLRRLGALMAVDADGRLRGVVTMEQVSRALRPASRPHERRPRRAARGDPPRRVHRARRPGSRAGTPRPTSSRCPEADAFDFLRFCLRNPKPCPVLEVTDPGSPEPAALAPGADLRTDVPRYRVWRDGELVDEPTDVARALGRGHGRRS